MRHDKYDRLVAAGVDPYPVGHPRTGDRGEVRERFRDLRRTPRPARPVAVTGRVVRWRSLGGLCFAVLRDGTGDLQVMLRPTGWARALRRVARDVDLGDHVGVTGEVVTSGAASCRSLAACGRSPPSACGRCRTSAAGCPTRRRGSGSATST